MKIAEYRRHTAIEDQTVSDTITKRILRGTLVFLLLISLAAVATIVVYWSLNNGTLTRFTI